MLIIIFAITLIHVKQLTFIIIVDVILIHGAQFYVHYFISATYLL